MPSSPKRIFNCTRRRPVAGTGSCQYKSTDDGAVRTAAFWITKGPLSSVDDEGDLPLRCSVWVRAVEASALGPHLPIDRMVANGIGAQALVKAAAAEGGGRRPAFTRAWAPMTIGRRGQWAALLSTPRTPVPPGSGGDRNNPLPTRCSEEPTEGRAPLLLERHVAEYVFWSKPLSYDS